MVKITIPEWPHVSAERKEELLKLVKLRFEGLIEEQMENTLQHIGNLWKCSKSRLRTKLKIAHEKGWSDDKINSDLKPEAVDLADRMPYKQKAGQPHNDEIARVVGCKSGKISLMAATDLFAIRGSHQKLKYKKEERQHPLKVYDALSNHSKLNLTADEEVEIEYEVDGWFYVKKERPGMDGKMASLVPVLYVSQS
ncbi:hypothetical protein Sjap_025892 [Stephania japonica]|uniref:SH3 domain-containing protein n=1 Tax=Stephania japonica TaxID=461633 RepID=A0AAP0E2L2_9MAGN